MKKSKRLLALTLVLTLLLSMMAAFPASADQYDPAQHTIKNENSGEGYTDLALAIQEASADETLILKVGEIFEVDAVVIVNTTGLTIKTETGTPAVIRPLDETIAGNLVTITANNVKLENLIVQDANASGIHVYKSTGVVLDQVTVTGSKHAGLIVNGSEVEIKDFTTSNNAWGGIDITKGYGVNDEPHLTIDGTLTVTEVAGIWIDIENPNNYDSYIVGSPAFLYDYISADGNNYVLTNKKPPVYNENQDIWYDSLPKAVEDADPGDVITLSDGAEIELTETLFIDKLLTIQGEAGAQPVIRADDNWNSNLPAAELNLINILADGVTLENLCIQDAIGNGVHVYESENVSLKGVAIENSAKAALLVNGSEVEVDGLTTSGNNWGGIEITKGDGVTKEPHLTIDDISGITEAVSIWIDIENPNDYDSYIPGSSTFPNKYINAEGHFVVATNLPATIVVYNETQDIWYDSLEKAVEDADPGDVITLSDGAEIELTETLFIDKLLTIQGEAGSTNPPIIKPANTWQAKNDYSDNLITVDNADGVKLENLEIVGSLRNGITFQNATNVVINDITIVDSAAAAIIINGAKVKIGNLTTSNNIWGAINVDDQGSPSLELTGTLNISEEKAIWTEMDNPEAYMDLTALSSSYEFYINAEGHFVVSTNPPATIVVHNETQGIWYASLEKAVEDANPGDVITLSDGAEIELTETLFIDKLLTIQGEAGAQPVIRADDNWNSNLPAAELNLINILADGVTLDNLCIQDAKGNGVHVYVSNDVSLKDVAIENSAKAGLVVNGSTVEVENLTTSGNAWGGIEITKGNGVNEDPLLTIDDISGITEAVSIWIDIENPNDYDSYIPGSSTFPNKYINAEGHFVVATNLPATIVVHNETQGIWYASLEKAVEDANPGDVITLSDGAEIELTETLFIDKLLTIQGEAGAQPVIRADDNWNSNLPAAELNLINILADGVTLDNLCIQDAKGNGVHVYVSNDVSLKDVAIENSAKAALLVNGSEVKVENLTTSGNAWGGIEITKGNGVNEDPLLTIDDISGITEAVSIWVDIENPNDYDSYIAGSSTFPYKYINADDHFVVTTNLPATIVVNNETQGIWYASLEKAVEDADPGDVIILTAGADIYLDNALSIVKPLTIKGEDDTNLPIIQQATSGTIWDNLITIEADGVKLENIKVIDSEKSGIHVYHAEDVVLENVTIEGCTNAALIVNGSLVDISDFNTSGNGWGGINIDDPSLANDPVLTISGPIDIQETDKIWTELDLPDTRLNLTYPGLTVTSTYDNAKQQYFYTFGVVATYTVTYDPNGGGPGAAYAVTENVGDDHIVLADSDANLGYIKAGYTFLGWDEDKDETTPTYVANDTITGLTSSITLYAIWEALPSPTTYTVTYDPNGGGPGAAYAVTENVGDDHIVLADSDANLGYIKAGYTFLGWDEDKDETTPTYVANDTITGLTSSITLYAIWQALPSPTTYTVTYDPNGGGPGAAYAVTENVGDDHIVLADSDANLGYIKAGYTFLGWDEDKDETTPTYVANDTITGLTSSITLYAIWQALPSPTSYTVTYDPNGGTGMPYDVTENAGDDHTVLADSDIGYTRAGYTFLGWDEDEDATTPTYVANDTITGLTSSITLYAIWQALPPATSYTVTYDPNGGTGMPYDVTENAGDDHTVLPNDGTAINFEKSDYTFRGWSTDPSATTVEYMPGDEYTAGTDETLYAVWALTSDLFDVKMDADTVLLRGKWANEQTGDVTFWVSFDGNAITQAQMDSLILAENRLQNWDGVWKYIHTYGAPTIGSTKTIGTSVYTEVKVPVDVHDSGVSALGLTYNAATLATAYIITPGDVTQTYGVINAGDVGEIVRVINMVPGTTIPQQGLANDFAFEMMDMDGDGKINSADVGIMCRIINNLIEV